MKIENGSKHQNQTNKQMNEMNSVDVTSKLITNLSNDNLIHMKIRIDLNNSFSPFTRLNIFQFEFRICSFHIKIKEEETRKRQNPLESQCDSIRAGEKKT